jgi:flagellar biosynthesis protein FlhG
MTIPAKRTIGGAASPQSREHASTFGSASESYAQAEDEQSNKVVSITAAKPAISPMVIAVTSGKGGVGKTNISVNLALALGSQGARVLCVDADLGLANMDIVMGLAPTATTAELIRGEVDVEDVLIAGPKNVSLLPGASGQYDLANLDDHQRRNLFAAVDTLDDRFDVVIVDTGAGVGSNAVGFAAAAKDIIVVVTPEPTSVADAYGMIKVLSQRCGVRRMLILANFVKSPVEGERVFARLTSLTDRFLNVSLEYLGHVPQDLTVARAVMRGEPFVLTHPDCPAAKAVGNAAQKLLETSHHDERQGAIRLFWRKLLRQGDRS